MNIPLALKKVDSATSIVSGIFDAARSQGKSHAHILVDLRKGVRDNEWFKNLPNWAWVRINMHIKICHQLMYKVVLHHAEYARMVANRARPAVVTYQHYEFGWPVISYSMWENLPPGIAHSNRTKCSYDELTRRFSVSRFEWVHNGRPYTEFTYNVHPDKSRDDKPTEEELAIMGLSNSEPWDPAWARSYDHAKSVVLDAVRHKGEVVYGYDLGDIPPVLAMGFGIAAPHRYE